MTKTAKKSAPKKAPKLSKKARLLRVAVEAATKELAKSKESGPHPALQFMTSPGAKRELAKQRAKQRPAKGKADLQKQKHLEACKKHREKAAFWQKDWKEILEKEGHDGAPLEELLFEEKIAFERFLASKAARFRVGDFGLLCDLEEMLQGRFPKAWRAWVETLREKATEEGFIDWARKNPGKVF